MRPMNKRVTTQEDLELQNKTNVSPLKRQTPTISKNLSAILIDKTPQIRIKSSSNLKKSQGEIKLIYKSLEQTAQSNKGQQFDFSDIGKINPLAQSFQFYATEGRAQSAYQRYHHHRNLKQQQQINSLLDKKVQLSTIQNDIFGSRRQNPTRYPMKKTLASLLNLLQRDFDQQVICKQLFINQQKILQILLMIAPPTISESSNFMHFFCIHRKLLDQLKELTQESAFQRPIYVIELDRLFYCLQYLGIPITLPSLIVFAQSTGSLSLDVELGMIVSYAKLFCYVKLVLAQIRMQSQDIAQNMSSTTANGSTEQEEIDSKTLVGKIQQRQIKRKANYKLKRLGYLNENRITEFYDSYADLIKTVGSELNAKQYNFHHLKYGYYSLNKHFSLADNQIKEELSIMGLQRNTELPLWIQAVYKHKVYGDQDIILTKIFFYFPKEESQQDMNKDFFNRMIYTISPNQSNCNQLLDMSDLGVTLSNQFSYEKMSFYKNFHKEEIELNGVVYVKDFDDAIQFDSRKQEYDYQAQCQVSSDSENETEIYEPIFVKSIQSYPIMIEQCQFKETLITNEKFTYAKQFTSTSQQYLEDYLQKSKIKSAFQFKENFMVMPKEENGSTQKHFQKGPEVCQVTDESDNEFFEVPLDAIDQWNELEKIKFQYVTSDLSVNSNAQNYKTQQFLVSEKTKSEEINKFSSNLLKAKQYDIVRKDFFKSEISSKSSRGQDLQIVADEKSLQKFLHELAEYQNDQSDSYLLRQMERFTIPIHLEFYKGDVGKEVELKSVYLDGDTPVIDRLLSSDIAIRLQNEVQVQAVESEEDPSFDEEPIQVELPERAEISNEQDSEEKVFNYNYQKIPEQFWEDNSENQNEENLIETTDLQLTFENGVSQLQIVVKDEYVSNLITLDELGNQLWSMRFFLGERIRKTESDFYDVAMEGKQVKSIQLNVHKIGNKVFMKSFGVLAVVDQKIEEEQLKKIKKKESQKNKLRAKQQYEEDRKEEELQEQHLGNGDEQYAQEIEEFINLNDNWQQGQIIIHLFYSTQAEIIVQLMANIKWLKQILMRIFPEIMIIENENHVSEDPNTFESYIYGIGPIVKRDGNNRVLLFKKDQEDWSSFLAQFQFRSLILLDTLCVLISLYGNVLNMSIAQQKYLNEHLNKNNRSLASKLNQYAYKYLENKNEKDTIRPMTGFNRPKSVKALNRYLQMNQ